MNMGSESRCHIEHGVGVKCHEHGVGVKCHIERGVGVKCHEHGVGVKCQSKTFLWLLSSFTLALDSDPTLLLSSFTLALDSDPTLAPLWHLTLTPLFE